VFTPLPIDTVNSVQTRKALVAPEDEDENEDGSEDDDDALLDDGSLGTLIATFWCVLNDSIRSHACWFEGQHAYDPKPCILGRPLLLPVPLYGV
jgi:hypothetical protein